MDLGVPQGHEAGFERPALIISNDRLAEAGLVTVLPITRTALGYPSHVEIEPVESGLSATSYVQTEQVRTVSTDRLVDVVQSLPDVALLSVEQRVRTNLSLH